VSQTLIGHYELGVLSVALYLRSGEGAEYYTHPEPGKPPRIKVGASGHWDQAVSRLLHEAMEYTLDNHKCRYRQTMNFLGASDGVSFHIDHNQFSMACDDVARFITACLPALSKEWNKPKWRRQ
jgi:hypothetical protein